MDIEGNLAKVKERMASAASRAGRDPGGIELVAVTKTVDVDAIRRAIEAGVEVVGENRVQDAKGKHAALDGAVRWHMIGHLQRNKVRDALGIFEMIHSIDSLRLARAVDGEAAKRSMIVPVMVEVNVSGEQTKYGVAPGDLAALVAAMGELENIRTCGLMTMAPFVADAEEVRPVFASLRRLRAGLRDSGFDVPYLSMGMTQDYEVAIEEGATHVRIGSAIFGPRKE
jgi:PLP dependent protein